MAFGPEPFQALSRLQDQLAALVGASTERQSFWGPPSAVFPPINVFRNERGLVVRAELPDVRPEDIALNVEGRHLTISGERKPPEPRAGYHRRERPWGKFSRTVHLPDDVDTGKVEARCRNGVLTVTVPVAEAAKPRQISVSVN